MPSDAPAPTLEDSAAASPSAGSPAPVDTRSVSGLAGPVKLYFAKWHGLHKAAPPLPSLAEVVWSFVGAFVGIAVLAALTHDVLASSASPTFVLIIGSMGATAVLVYAAPTAPLSQPRNVIGGHALSAVVGVAIRILIGDMACGGRCSWLSAALSVSLSIAVMLGTGTLHPPGGATALIAATADPAIRALGWWYVLFPAVLGAVIMVAIGLVVNNLSSDRVYPQRWL